MEKNKQISILPYFETSCEKYFIILYFYLLQQKQYNYLNNLFKKYSFLRELKNI